MESSLKVSIPLKVLQGAAFFHESDVLEVYNDDGMNDLFESLCRRAETFENGRKRKYQLTDRQKGPADNYAAKKKRSLNPLDGAPQTSRSQRSGDRITLPDTEPSYCVYEQAIANKVFRHQIPWIESPQDPRKHAEQGEKCVYLKVIRRYADDLRTVPQLTAPEPQKKKRRGGRKHRKEGGA